MTGTVIIAAVILAVPATWIGGELHKRNCIETGRRGCSVLPWVDGSPRKHPAPNLFSPPGRGGGNGSI